MLSELEQARELVEIGACISLSEAKRIVAYDAFEKVRNNRLKFLKHMEDATHPKPEHCW